MVADVEAALVKVTAFSVAPSMNATIGVEVPIEFVLAKV